MTDKELETWFNGLDEEIQEVAMEKPLPSGLTADGKRDEIARRIKNGLLSSYAKADDETKKEISDYSRDVFKQLGTSQVKPLDYNTLLENKTIELGKPMDESVLLEKSIEWGMTPEDAKLSISKAREVWAREQSAQAALNTEILRQYSVAAMNNDKDAMEKLRTSNPQLSNEFAEWDEENSGLGYIGNRIAEFASPRAYETSVRQMSTNAPMDAGEVLRSGAMDFVDNTAGTLIAPYAGKGIVKGVNAVGKKLSGQALDIGTGVIYSGRFGNSAPVKAMRELGKNAYTKGQAIANKTGSIIGGAAGATGISALAEGGNALMTNSDYNWARPLATGISNFTAPSLAEGAVIAGQGLLGHVPVLKESAEGVANGLRKADNVFDRNDAVIDIATRSKNLTKLNNGGLTDEAFNKEMMKLKERDIARQNAGMDPVMSQKIYAEEFNELATKTAPSKRQLAQTERDLNQFEADYGTRLDADANGSQYLWNDPKSDVLQVEEANQLAEATMTPKDYSEWLYTKPKLAGLIGDKTPVSLSGTPGARKVGQVLGENLGVASDIMNRSLATTNGSVGWNAITPATSVTNDKKVQELQKKDKESRWSKGFATVDEMKTPEYQSWKKLQYKLLTDM